jgi:hypothetical protein
MGFLDKAKKVAEQAQAKLDEAQKQFNESQQGSAADGPVTEYDKHGRPVGAAPPPPPPAPAPEAAAAAPAPPTPPTRDDEYAPPKLTSGDPLEG